MRFSIFNSIPVAQGLDTWRAFNDRISAAGFEQITVGDVSTNVMEMTCALTLLASETSGVRLGTTISNPVTRHPVVMAAAHATLSTISGGRAWLGIGTGNSALRNIGVAPAKLSDLEEYVGTFRELISTGRGTYRGETCHLPWAPSAVPQGVPVYMAANGPRSLRLAGRIADGVIVGGGVTDEVVDSSLGYIAEGARAAGRSLHDLDVWFQVNVMVLEPGEEVGSEVWDVLAAIASRNFRSTLEGKGVPDDLVPAIRRLEDEYRYDEHLSARGHNRSLVEDEPLRAFLSDLWLIAGTGDAVVDRLRRLEAKGVTGVHIPVHVPDPFRLVDDLGRSVIPFAAGVEA